MTWEHQEELKIILINQMKFQMNQILYLFIKYGTDYVKKAIPDITLNPKKNKLKRFFNKKINSIVKEPQVISPEDDYRKALDLFIREHTEILLVTKNKKYIGYLSQNTFLESKYHSNIKLSDIGQEFILQGE